MKNSGEIVSEHDDVFFRHQFLLCDGEINALGNWPVTKVGDHNLYTHPALEVTSREASDSGIVILGYLYDYRHPHHLNRDIVDALTIDGSLDVLLDQLKYMSGIYLVIWKRRDEVFLIPDAGAVREAYVYRNEERVIVGSTPNILELACRLHTVDDDFYRSALFEKRFVWVSDKTSYQDVVRLKPNHYLTLSEKDIVRFFPVEKRSPVTVAEAVREASVILPGIMKAHAHREKKLMIGLTSGWDSRVLLAASRDIKDKLIYHVNIYDHAPKSDHRIPIRLAQKLNLTFLAIRLAARESTAEESEKAAAILKFAPRTGGRNLRWLQESQSLFPGYKSITGAVSEIARNQYGEIKNLTGAKLAELANFPDNAYCAERYEEWLAKNSDVFTRSGYAVLDMFYWEEAVGNGLGKWTTDLHARDFHAFAPFNCRILLTTLLAVDTKYRQKQYNILYREIVRSLWKEAINEPVNPSIKRRIVRFLEWLQVYALYRRIFAFGIEGFRRRVFRSKTAL